VERFLFTLLVAHFLTQDEKIDPAKVAALLTGFAGTAVLIGPELLVDGSNAWGELACLGAALSYAFAGVYGRRFKILKIAPIEAAAGQVTASTGLILPIMLATEQPWALPALPSLTVWAALVGLALLSTALAYILYFRILAVAGATTLLLVTFLIPVTAILLGYLVLGEQISPREIFGALVIGSALLLIDGRVLEAFRRLRMAR